MIAEPLGGAAGTVVDPLWWILCGRSSVHHDMVAIHLIHCREQSLLWQPSNEEPGGGWMGGAP